MIIRKEDMLNIVRDSPGIDFEGVAEIIGVDLSTIPAERVGYLRSKVMSCMSALVRQGYLEKVGDGWRERRIITPAKREKGMKRLIAEYRGENRLVSELCREKKMGYALVKGRLYNGWTIEEALETPAGGRRYG